MADCSRVGQRLLRAPEFAATRGPVEKRRVEDGGVEAPYYDRELLEKRDWAREVGGDIREDVLHESCDSEGLDSVDMRDQLNERVIAVRDNRFLVVLFEGNLQG